MTQEIEYNYLEDALPDEGEFVLVTCPRFCECGFEIAQYYKGNFISQANGSNIIAYVVMWASFPDPYTTSQPG